MPLKYAFPLRNSLDKTKAQEDSVYQLPSLLKNGDAQFKTGDNRTEKRENDGKNR